MGATTSQGTGPGAADNIKPKILNGAVAAGNIQPQALNTYHGDINALANNGNITAVGGITSSGAIYGASANINGAVIVSGNISAVGGITSSGAINAASANINGAVIVSGTIAATGAITSSGAIYGASANINGAVIVSGTISATGVILSNTTGQLLNTSLNISSGTYTSISGTYTDIMSVSYTPVRSGTNIVVGFDANFSINGAGGDSFGSRIMVSGSPIITRTQTFATSGSPGASDIRGNVLFPVSYLYQNATAAVTTIAVQAALLTGEDTLTVNKSQVMLTITEYVR